MKIIINSHIESDIPRNHLLESFKENDVDLSCVIVVLGGYYDLADYEIITEKDITYIRANHNSIDFTGLIMLLELFHDDHRSD